MKKISSKLIVVCFIILYSTVGAGEIVRQVSFAGEKPKVFLINRRGATFQPDSLAADSLRIISYYQERGWFDCQVAIDVKRLNDGIRLDFTVDKRGKYLLNVKLDEGGGQKSFSGKLRSLVELYNGRAATGANIEGLANEVIRVYSNNGYPYCEAKVSDIKMLHEGQSRENYQLSLALKVQPGPLMTVERIGFPGRKRLGRAFLENYSGLKTPFLYSDTKLRSTQRRLSLAKFLIEAGDFKLRYSKLPNKGVALFPVREVSPLIVDGAIGYSSGHNQFYGRLEATISNILGRGRQVEINWSKKDRFSRRLKVGIREPYPMGIPVAFNAEVYQNDRDSLFIESGLNAGISFISSDIFAYGFSLGASRISPETYGKSILAPKDKLRLLVNFSADTRDFPGNPRTGDYFYIEGVFVSERVKGVDGFAARSDNYRTVSLQMEKLMPLFESSVLYAGITGRGDFSEDISPDRQFPLGGFGSLRGYRQDIFYVSRAAIATAEYRLLTSRSGRAYIFTDMAFFQVGDSSNRGALSETEFKAGFGLGLAEAVNMGLFTVEVAVPHDEGVSSAKLHFGIRTGF